MNAAGGVKDYLEYLGIVTAMRLLSVLPLSASFPLFGGGARLAWLLAGKRRQIGEANLRKCFPELPAAQRDRILKASLQSLAWSIPEFTCQKQILREPERWLPIEGHEHVAPLLKEKRGFFMGSGHFGTWGMMWAVPRLLRPFGIIVKRMENPYMDRFVERVTAGLGCVRIADRGTGEVILSAVERGLLVGFYMDQAALPYMGKKVDFFGHPAYTHLVPYYLAIKHQIPFVPVFGVRLGPGRSKMVIRPPLPAQKTADKIGDLMRMAAAMNRELEAIIRAHPEMYMWMHDRFKRADEPELETIIQDHPELSRWMREQLKPAPDAQAPGNVMLPMGRVIKDTWD